MNKPEKTYRIGAVTASVFCNTIDGEGGAKERRSVRLERRYRTGEGEWKSTSSFGLAELPQAMAVLQLALDYVASKEAEMGG
ncbi:MAG: hypothetical protein KY475_21055 [Planctomycetes bacterium]|nr:hypothetical protein [Planctomycetota bacterium]